MDPRQIHATPDPTSLPWWQYLYLLLVVPALSGVAAWFTTKAGPEHTDRTRAQDRENQLKDTWRDQRLEAHSEGHAALNNAATQLNVLLIELQLPHPDLEHARKLPEGLHPIGDRMMSAGASITLLGSNRAWKTYNKRGEDSTKPSTAS